MYLEHFGLNESPFKITPNTDFFFAGARRGEILEALQYAIRQGEGIVKVVGEVGSGKTMLCRVLMEQLPANVDTIYLANPRLGRDEVLLAIADELGLRLDGERQTTMIRMLQQCLIERFAAGRQVVVLIDEAHAMPLESLEEVRLLSNLETRDHKLLQIVLFGQPELEEVLARSDMRQLKERITHGFTLLPMHRPAIGEYLMFRLRASGYRGPHPFSHTAIRCLALASQGLTRRVNIIADKALLAAFAAGTYQVGLKEVQAAIRDSGLRVIPLRWLLTAIAGLFLLSAFVILAWTMHRPPAVSSVAPVKKVVISAPVAAVPTPKTQDFKDRLLVDRNWLLHQEDGMITIQLLLSRKAHVVNIERFVTENLRDLPVDLIKVTPMREAGQDYVGVFYGSFVSRLEAEQALRQLPASVKATGATFRTLKSLRMALSAG